MNQKFSVNTNNSNTNNNPHPYSQPETKSSSLQPLELNLLKAEILVIIETGTHPCSLLGEFITHIERATIIPIFNITNVPGGYKCDGELLIKNMRFISEGTDVVKKDSKGIAALNLIKQIVDHFPNDVKEVVQNKKVKRGTFKKRDSISYDTFVDKNRIILSPSDTNNLDLLLSQFEYQENLIKIFPEINTFIDKFFNSYLQSSYRSIEILKFVLRGSIGDCTLNTKNLILDIVAIIDSNSKTDISTLKEKFDSILNNNIFVEHYYTDIEPLTRNIYNYDCNSYISIIKSFKEIFGIRVFLAKDDSEYIKNMEKHIEWQIENEKVNNKYDIFLRVLQRIKIWRRRKNFVNLKVEVIEYLLYEAIMDVSHIKNKETGDLSMGRIILRFFENILIGDIELKKTRLHRNFQKNSLNYLEENDIIKLKKEAYEIYCYFREKRIKELSEIFSDFSDCDIPDEN